MEIRLTIPDAVAAVLQQQWPEDDIPRHILEDLALKWYQEEMLTAEEVRLALGLATSLLRFDLFPSRAHLVRGAQFGLTFVPAEDMRVPPHELIGDGLHRIGNREMPALRLELRHEHRLEQEVAELLADGGVIVRVDRLQHFVGFLEHERLEAVDRLLAIPRAAIWRTQARDDVDEALEFGGCCGHLIT